MTEASLPLDEAVREVLPEEVTLEQKEKKELVAGRSGKRVPGRRNSMYKGPEVGIGEVSVPGGK